MLPPLMLLGGSPCGTPPNNKPPRYANNPINRKRFNKANPMPSCPPRKKRELPPVYSSSVVKPKKIAQPKRKSTDSLYTASKSASEDSVKPIQCRHQKGCPHRTPSSDSLTIPSSTSSVDQPHSRKSKQDIISLVIEKGKKIGRGKEAVVYLYNGYAYKIFNDRFQPERVKVNIDFLIDNKKSKSVPIIYDYSNNDGWIKMEYMKDYKPIHTVILTETPQTREKALKAIAKARAHLKKNIKYSDLSKFGNIGLNKDMSSAIFYEGGTAIKHRDNLQANEYVKEMASKFRITNSNFAKQVRDGQIKDLR